VSTGVVWLLCAVSALPVDKSEVELGPDARGELGPAFAEYVGSPADDGALAADAARCEELPCGDEDEAVALLGADTCAWVPTVVRAAEESALSLGDAAATALDAAW
jgi:hypothetical protein